MIRQLAMSALIIAPWLLGGAAVPAGERALFVAAAPQSEPPAAKPERELTPEQRMQRRFPQPVRVGDLIGLPVLDWRDSTIGYIRQVVRTSSGKIQLIVPYRPWLGWLAAVDWGRRPVAVPIEVVAILGRQVAALDMPREEFDSAPTFSPSSGTELAADETIRIALTRR
jgi:hypothetical protein